MARLPALLAGIAALVFAGVLPFQSAGAQSATAPLPSPPPIARGDRPAPTLDQPAPPQAVSGQLVLILVRNVFVAVGQAVAAGNYSVLRDLSASGFRRSFPESRLVSIFEPLASQQIDLTSSVLLVPAISGIRVAEDGTLAISGTMPTTPLPVAFDFLFQPISGSWQLLGIAMRAETPPPASKQSQDAKKSAPSTTRRP